MARNIQQDPLQKYKFKVSITGNPAALGFNKVTGLSRETDVAEYAEGGYEHIHKLSGREKVQPVTLSRGAYASKEMEEMFKKTLSDPNVRQTITIDLLDKYGEIQRSWNLAEAWVSKWSLDDLDSTSSDVAMESLEIQFEHFLD